jgi:hypothetical protein
MLNKMTLAASVLLLNTTAAFAAGEQYQPQIQPAQMSSIQHDRSQPVAAVPAYTVPHSTPVLMVDSVPSPAQNETNINRQLMQANFGM